jgi:deoxyhypusine synthase
MEIKDFIEQHYKHFNAGTLAECCSSLRNFLQKDGRMMITLAGAMSTAEIGRSLAPAIRAQKIHAICCTGANLEEDLFNLVAKSSYEKIDDWRSWTAEQDKELQKRGLNRVTDVAIPEEEAMRNLC